jgi:peroxiredoxin
MGPDTTFPSDLPIPQDDGACAHLLNAELSALSLTTTTGTLIDLSTLPGLTIVFCYPRTGAPGETVPDEWNAIPGARGCTPQACSFRDLKAELGILGMNQLFGLSTQDSAYQAEAKERLHLPFEILSDDKLKFISALKLPTFEWEGRVLVRRLTLAIQNGRIVKVWYPVFPPDKSAEAVVTWLKERDLGG